MTEASCAQQRSYGLRRQVAAVHRDRFRVQTLSPGDILSAVADSTGSADGRRDAAPRQPPLLRRRPLVSAGIAAHWGVVGPGDLLAAPLECDRSDAGRRTREVDHLALAVGRAEPSRHIRPQAASPGRVSRAVRAGGDRASRASQICELLPQLARGRTGTSLIRSLHTSSNDHGIAGTIGLTGAETGGISLGGQSTAGSVASRRTARSSPACWASRPGMPRFVTIGDRLHQGHKADRRRRGRRSVAGHDPFRLDYDRGARTSSCRSSTLIDGVSRQRTRSRAGNCCAALDSLARQLDRSRDVATARRVLSAGVRAAHVAGTRAGCSTSTRSRADCDGVTAGSASANAACWPAGWWKRGSRFVQVNWSSHVEPVEDTGDGGWDMHDRNFQQFQDRHAWMLDKSLSALLDDLRRARACSTKRSSIAVGEFGRTPKINGKAGRDHWHQCYSGLVAGGGLRCGEGDR